MSRAASSAKDPPREAPALPDSYLVRSELPFANLVFLLPLVILYELGTRYFATDPAHHTEQRIIAFNLMQQFFHLFGATGKYLPALAVVGILLAWHIARRDAWQVRGSTLVAMLIESAAWAVPLVVIGLLCVRFWDTHFLPLAATNGSWQPLIVLSLGAGVYEELVFRLMLFTLLNMLLVDALKWRKPIAYLGMVAISSIAFALYHYLGPETFSWRTFAFRTVAGVYFGLLFLLRGFGITSATHAAYDIQVVLLRVLRPL